MSQIVEQFHIGDVQQFVHDVETIYESYIFNKHLLDLFLAHNQPDITRKNLKARIREAETFRSNLIDNISEYEDHPLLIVQLRKNLSAYIDGLEMTLNSLKSKKRLKGPEYHVFKRLGFLYEVYTGDHPFDDLVRDREGDRLGEYDELGNLAPYGYYGPFMEFVLIAIKPLEIDMLDKGHMVYEAAKSLRH